MYIWIGAQGFKEGFVRKMETEKEEIPRNGIMGTIILQSNSDSSSEIVDLTNKVHQLPCCIKHNGPCTVSHYFKPSKTGVDVEGLSVEEACFRGRKLQGAKITIPEGYSGFVLGKKKSQGKRKASETSEENLSHWEMRARFQSINYWNHDSLPSHSDAFLRSLHWLPVANALHKPVSGDDLAHASNLFGVKLD
ncbi:hypothetical protein IFM89_002630 [Coptis chinensis]|uniref:Uncharacterized protein n=1 Tax=Coptis chinensis TaxID=261450 RepID=A0A835GUW8_9MAGN|nr:hypothetical protein IFM89_002630 [Coptis chinensis]